MIVASFKTDYSLTQYCQKEQLKMPRIAAVFDFIDMTQQQYDTVIKEYEQLENEDLSLVTELVIHVAIPKDGDMLSFDILQSEEVIGRARNVLGVLLACEAPNHPGSPDYLPCSQHNALDVPNSLTAARK